MRILELHCDYFRYEAKQKALKSAKEIPEDEKQGQLDNCLVVFVSFEQGDTHATVLEALGAVKRNYAEIKPSSLLLHPYAHLSSNLAKPDQAIELLEYFYEQAKKHFPLVKKSPFGWYKSFEMKCKGHPLAELSKTISGVEEVRVPVSKAVKEHNFVLKEKTLKPIGKAEEGKALRHSAALLLAMSVKKLYPQSKLGEFGLTEEGFYYDFDLNKTFDPKDFDAIETEMYSLLSRKLSRKMVSKQQALELFSKNGEVYKIELLEEVPLDAAVAVYECDGFVDLQHGAALEDLSSIAAFKLMKLGGAYWKGDSKKRQLQRLYGVAFTSKKALEEYLHLLEEAEKRDHRKLGKELDLFSVQDEGVGFPFMHPNGMIIRNDIEKYLREELQKRDYKEIRTPIILDESLWRRSGHWDHYKDNMYFTEIDGKMHAVKPMNCPGAILVYKTRLHSYRELPLRLAEFGLDHRHELSGVLSGLFRVRAFTQDDAHIFVTPEQMLDEVKRLIDLAVTVYHQFGFTYEVELSTRPEKYMGSLEVWNKAEASLKKALEEAKTPFKINDGDGAFYGPKIDFKVRDSIGRLWQLGTVQADFQMPEKFELEYDGVDGKKHRPVIIHRAILGSFERFFGVLIEHYAGAFPTWLSPVQAIVIPLSEEQTEYCKDLVYSLKENGVRAEFDDKDGKVDGKIRDAQNRKIPYMLVIGKKELESHSVSVRKRSGEVRHGVDKKEFLKTILEEIRERRN